MATPEKERLDRLRRRVLSLENERQPIFDHYRDITEYVVPRLGRFFENDKQRAQRRRLGDLINNRGTRSMRITAAGLMANASSPARPWFRYGLPDPELMLYQPASEWLTAFRDMTMVVLNKSNTYRALHTHYEEMVSFGTSCGLVLPHPKRVVHHYPQTAGQYCLAVNWEGEVDMCVRKFEMTVGQIARQFGLDNCSHTVRELARRGQLDESVTIVHVIEPRDNADPEKLDKYAKAWASIYFEAHIDDAQGILSEGGYDRFPIVAPRWNVVTGDVYGNSPAMEALGDIRSLQLKELRKAQAIDYQTAPPLQIPSSMKGMELDITPGGQNYVDPVGEGIRPMWQVQLDLSALERDIERTEMRISEAFFADLFRMMSMLSDTTERTRQEILERHEEKLIMLGPTIERLHNELLAPTIDLTVDYMMRAGLVPPPPQELVGQPLQVEFISVLAQAQKATGINNIDRFLGMLQLGASMRPEMLDKVNVDVLVDGYADMLGVDPRFIVATDKVKQLRQQRAAAMAAKEQLAAGEQVAGAVKNLASARTDQPSVLTDPAATLTGYGVPPGISGA